MKRVLTYCGLRISDCGMRTLCIPIRNPRSAIRNRLLRLISVLTIVIAMNWSGVSLAQENANPEEVKKNLADALNQLKAAQDRKNELATENEGLKARVAELEKQLNDQKQKTAELEDKTWFWRSHYFAWMKFIQRYPTLLAQWKLFMDNTPLNLPSLLPVWDESAVAPVTVEGAGTQKIDGTAKAAGE